MVLWQQPRSSPHLAWCVASDASGGAAWFLWPVAVSGLLLSYGVRTADLQETMTKKIRAKMMLWCTGLM